MPLPHNPFAAESDEDFGEPIPYELTPLGKAAAAWSELGEALREAHANHLAALAAAREQAAQEAVEEPPNEGTVTDDAAEQGDAGSQAEADETTGETATPPESTSDDASDGTGSHDVGPAAPETVPAAQKEDAGDPPADVPPVKKTTPRKAAAKKTTAPKGPTSDAS